MGCWEALCCDQFDTYLGSSHIYLLYFLFVPSTYTVVLIVHVSCANKEYIHACAKCQCFLWFLVS